MLSDKEIKNHIDKRLKETGKKLSKEKYDKLLKSTVKNKKRLSLIGQNAVIDEVCKVKPKKNKYIKELEKK